MSARWLLGLLGLLQLGCASSVTSLMHDSYWIQLPASYTKQDCMRTVAEVRRYALSAGYHSEDWQIHGGERLALFQRGDLSIDFLRRDGDCHINVTSGGYSARPPAIAERKRLHSVLTAHGIQARVEHGHEMVEIIDYSR